MTDHTRRCTLSTADFQSRPARTPGVFGKTNLEDSHSEPQMTPSMDATSTPQWSTFNEDPADFTYLRVTPPEPSGSRGLRDEEVSYPRPPDGVSKSSILESALFPRTWLPDVSTQEDYDDLLAESSRIGEGSKKEAADDFKVLSDFGVWIIDNLKPPNDMIFVEKPRTPQSDPLLELVKKRVVPGDPEDLTYLRKKEEETIISDLLNNGYTRSFIQRIARRQRPLKETAEESERPQEGIGLKRSWFSVLNKSNHEATEYEESSSTSVDEVSSYFQCSTAAGRWQRRVMDTKLNLNADPCEDFCSYVCSESWESDGELPYRAAGHAYIIMKVIQFIRKHEHAVRHNRSRGRLNFLDHASLFLTSCLSDANPGGLAQWDQIRALLRDVGLDDWPYLVPPPPPFHLDDVLKLVGRQLAIFPFVHVALRKRAENGDYIPHLDAPRNFLFVRYEMQKDSKSLPYREVIRRVLILWKSIRKSNTLTQEIVELEEDLFDASRPPRKQVWSRDMIVPVTQIPMLPRLRLDVYIWHLRQEAREVAILNPSYLSRLSTVLRKPTP
ncbi:hypothetical protein HPB47_023907 [Ixodes persulcatus]|uniref:Uncharacterized protein n=1 Tax=Ixodes persulcatus TaxID=34615 RepID=A0AC60Q831_IXOPE|nr:hypothetical protein HPB47_023907 [Ixodes persulcatus]